MADYASGSGRRTDAGILRLSAPLIVSFWLRSAFTWVDTAYASRLEGLGDASIAAIGLTMPFEFLMIACWVGASNGFTSRLAAAMGAGEGDRIAQLKRAAHRITRGLFVLFALVAALLWFFAEDMVPDPTVGRQFKIYGSILLLGSAFTSFWSIVPDSVVKAHQDTRSTMWAGILSSLLNVVLNSVFVFVFHWGIVGIALSTVIGRLAGLVYALARAAHHENRRTARGHDLRPGAYDRPVRAILLLAVPAGIGFVLMGLEGMAVNWILARTGQAQATLAAWSIFDQATRFLSMPAIAVAVAMLPLTARLFGKGDVPRIRRELRTALLFCFGYVILLVTPHTLVLGPLVAEHLTDARATQESVTGAMRIVPLAVILLVPLFPVRSTFEGFQRPRPGLLAGILRTALVVPLAWFGVRSAEALGCTAIEAAMAAFTVGVGVSTGILTIRLRGFLRRRTGRSAPDTQPDPA